MLKIPTSSLFRSGPGWAVFRVIDSTARLTPIEIGRRNGIEAEVVSGLRGKERIIVHPSDAITDGVNVNDRAPH